MWIQNIAYSDVKKAYHTDPGLNAMMINIVDPGMDFPVSPYNFKEIHKFEFLDLEYKNFNEGLEEFAITQEQANELVRLLQHAMDNEMNVLVSCVAGVCRSGAVCEVGVMMGFYDTQVFRAPNLLVKHRMMKALGWDYNEQEPHTINGTPIDEDWLNDNEKVFILANARRQLREQEGTV